MDGYIFLCEINVGQGEFHDIRKRYNFFFNSIFKSDLNFLRV